MTLRSGKQKNLAAADSTPDFAPYAISVHRGEDVMQKISFVAQKGSWRGCILSVYGLASSITVHHIGSNLPVTYYEGPFDILSLSGSFTITESNDGHIRMCYASISWRCPDNTVLGGAVAGPVIAADCIHVVVGLWGFECCELCKRGHVDDPCFTNLASASGQGAETTNCNHISSIEEEPSIIKSSNSPELNMEEATTNGEHTSPGNEADCLDLVSRLGKC